MDRRLVIEGVVLFGVAVTAMFAFQASMDDRGDALPLPGDVPLQTTGLSPIPVQELDHEDRHLARLAGVTVGSGEREHRLYGPFRVRNRMYNVVDVGEDQYAVFNRSGGELSPVADERVAAAVFATWQLYREVSMDPFLYSPGVGSGEGDPLRSYEEQLVLAEGVYRQEGRVSMPGTRQAVYDEVLQGRDLVPSRFIGALQRTSAVTDRFIEDPSYARARGLVTAYDTTQTAYMRGLRDLVGILETTIERTEGRPVMEMASGAVTDISVILDDLRLIRDNGAALRDEIEHRRSLLSAEGVADIPAAGPVPDWDGSNTSRQTVLAGQELREAYDARNNISYPLSRTEIVGPYRMRVPCLREDHLVSRVDSSVRTLYPELVVADASVRLVDRRGQPFSEGRPDSVFTACTCPYLETGRARWEVIDRMVDVVDGGIISDRVVEEADAAVRDDLRRASRYEQLFIGQPSSRGVEVLGTVYTDLYRALVQHRRSGGTVPEQLSMERLWRASVVSRSGLSAIAPTVDSIETGVASRGENVFDPARPADRPVDVFGPTEAWRHSFYPFAFMTWSDAVWRLDTGLQKYAPGSAGPLVRLRPLPDDR